MSSPEEDPNENESLASQSLKKRRVQRACDICRRKKVRCDGGQMPGNRCSNCVIYNYDCTYIEAAKKRGPPKGYVESLENRLQKMETLLHKLCPDADFTQELGGGDNWLPGPNHKASSSADTSSAVAVPPPLPAVDADDLEPSDDELSAQRTLANSLKQIQINPAHLRFFGKSSSVMFIQTAIEAKHEYAGTEMPKRSDRGFKRPVLPAKRPQFWGIHPWIMHTLQNETPHQEFPEEDLMTSLIDLYFSRVNDYMPLLHRPTFQKNVNEGLHLREEGFGSTVLLACAVGSRFSNDPRVFLEGSDSTHSCGWAWFRQVQLVRKSLLAAPRLYDLQICCLTAMFLQGTSAPQACWTVIGVGIRLAQDVGAHRRKVYNSISTVEEELWKRAFWVLVSMDRSMSMTLGRPCAIQDEDFDVELPAECDDEYWVISESSCQFKQAAEKPSKITFFNCLLRLNQILAFALRTIYSINKSKALLGFVGQQWEQHIVAELDSALNKWIDSVPNHLRWDPNREPDLFLNQSAYLYAHYYQLQIAVHRPFIPSPRKPSPLSFPSLAICTNAARSCTHVLDVPFRRCAATVLFPNQMALFTSGIVLLLNIWGGKRSGFSLDPAKEMADVHKCMRMLKSLEPRWHTAGRLWDVLYELASVGDLPLPQPSPAPSNKRDRDSDNTHASSSSPSTSNVPTSAPSPPDELRNIAGSRRVSRDTFVLNQQQQQQQMQPGYPPQLTMPSSTSAPTPAANPNYALPIYTEELGRLPLHPGYSQDHSGQEWNAASQMPSSYASSSHMGPPTTATAAAALGADPRFDPAMTRMFSMPPDVFEQVMSGFAANPSDSQSYSMEPGMTSMAGGIATPLTAVDGVSPTFPESDTLAMWSNAPQGFEWDDWGTYITNVSGMGNPSSSSQRPPGDHP